MERIKSVRVLIVELDLEYTTSFRNACLRMNSHHWRLAARKALTLFYYKAIKRCSGASEIY